jgi:hypothetical protein
VGLLRKMTGGTDKKLLKTGLLGRGIITDVDLTGTTVQSGNGLVQRKCVFTVEVSLDDREPYMATCNQRIPEIQIPQIQPGATTVAVRADPNDLTQIALDLTTQPPWSRLRPAQGITRRPTSWPLGSQRRLESQPGTSSTEGSDQT